MRREQVVGQGFPIREVQYRQVRGKESQLFLQAFGALAVGRQQQGEALGAAGGFGNRQAQRGAGQVAPVLFAAGGGKFGQVQYGHGRHGSLIKDWQGGDCSEPRREQASVVPFSQGISAQNSALIR